MGPNNEAMLGSQIQNIHLNKRKKRENIMGKTLSQITMHKKNEKKQK
jgi:hypothetical protein